MKNKDIASKFNMLAKLMELHDENIFKVRSYQNTFRRLKRYPWPLSDMTSQERTNIEGIGKAISGKIAELLENGEMDLLNRMRSITPTSVIEMLDVPGLTPKKVKKVWNDLNILTPEALLDACLDGQLVKVKGFGPKMQAETIDNLKFYFAHKGEHLYADIRHIGDEILSSLNSLDIKSAKIVGPLARKMPLIDRIDVIYVGQAHQLIKLSEEHFSDLHDEGDYTSATYINKYPVRFYGLEMNDPLAFYRLTAGDELFEKIQMLPSKDVMDLAIPYERLDSPDALNPNYSSLLELRDIKGVIHSHTKYSDGENTIAEMAIAAAEKGFKYIAISDHSKSAVYAGGMSIEEVMMQHREIDELNSSGLYIPILKSIESDILRDGSLDYPEDILASFDIVIASVHSNLKMEIGVATDRLLRAVHSPYTNILGHMTGRLLLNRKGYEVDYQAIFDACAKNNVSIEINANPKRLDLDWSYVKQATDTGVKISINPDAHNIHEIDFIEFGVITGRKGGLIKANCINSFDMNGFMSCFIPKTI